MSSVILTPGMIELATRVAAGGGRWVTIRGVHVYIKGGVITKGPADMVGKSPDDVGKIEAEHGKEHPDVKRATDAAKKHKATTVTTDAKAAAEHMAEGALNSPFESAEMKAFRTANPGDVPTKEQVAKNWAKVFNSKANTESGKKAFEDIPESLVATVQDAVNDNADNPNFAKYAGKYPHPPVVIRNAEKGNGGQAEFRAGVTHVFVTKWAETEVAGPIKPGEGTMAGSGGTAAVLRHEYGHGLHDTYPLAKRDAWASYWHTDEAKADLKTGISTYATRKNPSEGFCETFAMVTHRDYADDHPAINDATRRVVAKWKEIFE